nr:hypothetical protein [Geothermobacter hydrogeniphilus]
MSIVEADYPSVGSVVERQAVTAPVGDMLIDRDPPGFKFDPVAVCHGQNFSIQIQEIFKVEAVQMKMSPPAIFIT